MGPKNGLMNFGITTLVTPLYATNRGKVAIVGTISLCLHLRSITSSTNPKSTAMHVASNPALYSINLEYYRYYLTLSDVKSRRTWLMMVTIKKTMAITMPRPSGLKILIESHLHRWFSVSLASFIEILAKQSIFLKTRLELFNHLVWYHVSYWRKTECEKITFPKIVIRGIKREVCEDQGRPKR